PEPILLFGPPGTEKTLLDQTMAKESGSFFLNLNGEDIKTTEADFMGDKGGTMSTDKVKQIFAIVIQEAGPDKGVIALIDEIDRMG
ncbi:11312_t:CDS:1, partial [Ambispora gerdemannii]